MPQGLLLFLSNSALFLLRKAPNNPRQKTAAKQARIIPVMSITIVRKWGRGKHLYPLVTAFPGPELNLIHAQVQ